MMVRKAGDEPIHIAFDQRTDAGIDGCQYSAFVFARLRPHVAGQLDPQVHAAPSDGIPRGTLVGCVAVAVQKHDDGNLSAGVLEFARCPHHRFGVERLDLLPVGVHASADLAHQGARHQRLWPPGVKSHRVRHSEALQFKKVPEAG